MRALNYARIFIHYAKHDYFLEENQLIERADRLADIPVQLMTGRYDMCTPPNNAFDLAQVLPNARLQIVANAGHYPTEYNMARAICEGSVSFARWLEQAGRI